jgi:putative FmdB family regulatory protein
MPTYDYECLKCGHRFEVRQNMQDQPVEGCPECGGKVRRLMGAPQGIIKGGHASGGQGSDIRCGRDTTCCGRDTPCSKRPCDD